MALIKCIECGKEISDKAKKCTHCGYKERKAIKFNLSKKTTIISCGILLLLITTIGIILFLNREKPLTDIEKDVISIIGEYKSTLKNPDSIQVFEIRYKYSETSKNSPTPKLQVLFDTSGQNGFGGQTRTIEMYQIDDEKKIERYGNDSKANMTITSYTSTSELFEITLAKVINDTWLELQEKDDNNINIDRIMKNVK